MFVGAFDWEVLRELTTTYLASLPAAGRVEEWRDVEIDPPPGIEDEVVRSGIEPRSLTVWEFAGEAEWTGSDATALHVAGEMLATRLRERVREQLGGAYSISASGSALLLPDQEYRIRILFGSDPARVDELLAEIEVELDWLRAGGEQGYLDTVKEQMRSTREEQLRDNGFWLGQVRSLSERGNPLSSINEFDATLESITLEDIAEVAERYLPADRYVRLTLLPEDEQPSE